MEIKASLLFDEQARNKFILEYNNFISMLGNTSREARTFNIINDIGEVGEFYSGKKLEYEIFGNGTVGIKIPGITHTDTNKVVIPFNLRVHLDCSNIGSLIIPWIDKPKDRAFEILAVSVGQHAKINKLYMPMCDWILNVQFILDTAKNIYLYSLEERDWVTYRLKLEDLTYNNLHFNKNTIIINRETDNLEILYEDGLGVIAGDTWDEMFTFRCDINAVLKTMSRRDLDKILELNEKALKRYGINYWMNEQFTIPELDEHGRFKYEGKLQ